MNMEFVGYLASFTVMTSLLMGNVVWLRVINLVGCILFTAYGLAVEAYPVVLLNGICVFINLYHLAKLRKEQQQALTPLEA
ncbi:YgjV family protein [Pseudovibrio sp. Tun.PSC04-5.I4]|uniref:YgjV family protein n=1 Tax=Pseudovibrio sp. Tun.PSC04-5.I4 TaxID=1798213 RepID=UPI00088548EE|nr:YgjV family protein [Pseudovibrio sp. Tun.PSC04-5.I4]SDR22260.1 inner membrane protein [Pseudovibrio sp. Tun.PSC04-5.I4]